MNFIVVNVNQDYDYVEGIEFVKSFVTEDEANDFVLEKENEHNAVRRARLDYIDQWVDALEVPNLDDPGWRILLKKWKFVTGRNSSPESFKKNLKGYLRTNHSATLEGYDPPSLDFKLACLHVVEIKESSCQS